MPPTTDLARQAATVALVRHGGGGFEVLLVERPASMAFAGGHHVFPGGTVDPGDRDPALRARSALTPEALAAAWAFDLPAADALASAVAAIREVFEEVGVLLATPGGIALTADERALAQAALLDGSLDLPGFVERHDLRLASDRLVPLSRWVTPRGLPRRFDARFYVAEVPPAAPLSFSEREVAGHYWLTPRAALEWIARRRMRVLPPTSTTLQQLEHVRSMDEVRARLSPGAGGGLVLREPAVDVVTDTIVRIELPAGGGIPGQRVNAYLVGRRELALFDPGDPGEAAGEAILGAAAARGGRIVAIALTHADPDHAAGALGLALRLGVPVIAGPGADAVLPFDVRELPYGVLERLDVGDEPVVAQHAPGHRPDHIVFHIGDQAASRPIIAGDLVGRLGSRSVYGQPYEAGWWFSLYELGPWRSELLLPGHGDPIIGRAAVAAALSAAAARPGSGGG